MAATGATDESIDGVASAGQPGARSASTAGKSTAFNPAISLILAGNYANLSNNPDDYAIQGFIPGGDEIGPGDRSFNLGESELTIASSIDPVLHGQPHRRDHRRQRDLGRGSVLPHHRAALRRHDQGRAVLLEPRLPERHPRTCLGFHGPAAGLPGVLRRPDGGAGAQAKWIAPLDLLVELGVESGNGNYFPGTQLTRNGLNGYVAYTHVGGDIGEAIAWRTGLSYVDLHAQDRAFEDPNAEGDAATNAFTGSSTTWIADAEFKWTPIGDPRRQYLKLQGEYMQRSEDGHLAYVYGDR